MCKASLIAALILLMILPAHAQDHITPAMQEQLDDIESRVNQMRQLDALAESPLIFPSQAQLAAFLQRRFAKDFPPEKLATDLIFYRALNLAEADVDLPSLLFDFILTWIGGYYDLESDAMSIVLLPGVSLGEELSITQRTTYAHEYVHALQDQHFDLQRIIDQAEAADNRDLRLAVQSLIEGEASHVMINYLRQLLAIDAGAVRQAFSAIPEQVIDARLPEVIFDATEFPYRQGYLFVAEVVAALGWEGINQALREKPPETTEQIYHPQRYLAGEGAIPINFPDVSEIVGEGWRLAYDGPVGEFYLRQHLDIYLDEPHISRLAKGWGGDRMQIFTGDSSKDLTWLLVQSWDSAADAAEFAAGYRYILERRYRSSTDDGTCWSAAITHCIVRISDSETRISAGPNADVALALLQVND